MEKKGENPDSMPPGGEDGAAPPPPLGDEAKAWAKSCLERLLSSTDPSIQRSATEALRGFGPAVLPVLREARDARGTDDEKARQAISRVITMIEKGPRPGGEGGKRPAPPNGNEGNPDKKPGQPPRGPAMLERVKTELGLDDTQLRPVGQALLQFGRDAREVGMDARDGLITYEDARTKVTELRGKLKDGLRSTLNEDQLKKLDSLLDEMGKKMGDPPGTAPVRNGARLHGTAPVRDGARLHGTAPVRDGARLQVRACGGCPRFWSPVLKGAVPSSEGGCPQF